MRIVRQEVRTMLTLQPGGISELYRSRDLVHRFLHVTKYRYLWGVGWCDAFIFQERIWGRIGDSNDTLGEHEAAIREVFNFKNL